MANELIKQLEADFTLTDEGYVNSYIVVQVDLNENNNTIKLKQQFFIQRIIEALKCNEHMTGKEIPVLSNKILHKDQDGPNRKQSWNYRKVISMLSYLSASIRPDISYAMHQCVRFYSIPKLSHGQAVKRIILYLIKTKNKGIEVKIYESKGIEYYVDVDFGGHYHKDRSDDATPLLSRT